MITKDQIRQVYACLKRLSEMTLIDTQDLKENLVFEVTNGRTEHLSDLTNSEADELIKHLNDRMKPAAPVAKPQAKQGDKIRKTIFHCAYEMRLINNRMTNEEKVATINGYIAGHEKIGLKKKLNEYTIPELQALCFQFSVFLKHFLTKVYA